MSFIGDIWGNMKFNAGKAATNAASSVSWAYTYAPAQEIIYRNNRAYKSVFVHVAKQMAMSTIEGQINKLFPKYQRFLEKRLRKTVLQQQKQNQIQLIKNRETQMKDWGRVSTIEGQINKLFPKYQRFLEKRLRKTVLQQQKQNQIQLIKNRETQMKDWGRVSTIEGHTIIAKDKYGNAVPEALMLSYEGETDIQVEDVKIVNGQQVKDIYTTKTICFIDINPDVAIQSSKNIVMTTVQGRDYTRKELVSGGDLNFTVTGEIVSNEEGVYPENDVKKFIQIMQYGGVVNVNHFQFKQFNVDKIIIKDFNMQNQEFKNIQPYTFTCVAVEPDEDVIVKSDTIAVINREIEVSPMSKWYKLILQNKYAEIVANVAASAVSSTVNAGVDAGVNSVENLVSNI